jgi:prepilin-type processing-associated H-X9-DG protein
VTVPDSTKNLLKSLSLHLASLLPTLLIPKQHLLLVGLPLLTDALLLVVLIGPLALLTGTAMKVFLTKQHDTCEGSNITFVDGHTKWMQYSSIWARWLELVSPGGRSCLGYLSGCGTTVLGTRGDNLSAPPRPAGGLTLMRAASAGALVGCYRNRGCVSDCGSAVYIRWGRPTPQEPQAPFLKGQPAGPRGTTTERARP